MSTNVIDLQQNRERLAAQRHARRCADKQRHPSSACRRTATVARGSAVVRQLDQHHTSTRSGTAPAHQLIDQVRAVAAFVQQRITRNYCVDEFGFDPQFTDAVIRPMLRPLYRSWFRVEVSGLEYLPHAGAALVVANHGGVLPLDALMLSLAVHDTHPAKRDLRVLASRRSLNLPVLGHVAHMSGHTLACRPGAHRLLTAGELVAVFPEGDRGLGKRFGDRYKLQQFAHGEFVDAAVAARAPIVPCTIVGAEESYPVLANLKPLARLLNLPCLPITPLLPLAGPAGLLPLPTKWHIAFSPPIPTAGNPQIEAQKPTTSIDLTNQVRQTIQHTLRQLLKRRRNVFLG